MKKISIGSDTKNTIATIITDQLRTTKQFQIVSFGTFKIVTLPKRKQFDGFSKKYFNLPERIKVKFCPSPKLIKRLSR